MRGRPRLRLLAAMATAGSVVVSMCVASASDAGAAGPATVALARSFLGRPAATDLGRYVGPHMGIEVVLAPSNAGAMAQDLNALYDPSSPHYHQWMAPGAFAARFAPTAAVRTSVESYLRQNGMTIVGSSSPFLVRATGSSSQVSSAFSTTTVR